MLRARDTTLNAAETDDAHVAGVIQRADLHLEGPFRIHLRGGDMFHDGVEDEAHILFEIIRIATGTSKQRRGINGAEVELLAGAKAIKEVKNFSSTQSARALPGLTLLITTMGASF